MLRMGWQDTPLAIQISNRSLVHLYLGPLICPPRARKETTFMKASLAVTVLSTQSDDKLTWIHTGVLFETLSLTAINVRFDLSASL